MSLLKIRDVDISFALALLNIPGCTSQSKECGVGAKASHTAVVGTPGGMEPVFPSAFSPSTAVGHTRYYLPYPHPAQMGCKSAK